MGAYVSDDIKARALALVTQGQSRHQVARAVGVHHVTVWRWLEEARNDPQLEEWERWQFNREYRIIEHAERITEQALTTIEEEGTGPKHLIALNAISGTLRDKQFKRKELALKERDQSQLMSELLLAIRDEASRLAASHVATQEQHDVTSAQETRLLNEAQNTEQST